MSQVRTFITITHSPIALGNASEFLQASKGGGVVLFEGITRRFTEGRETILLRYEAHEPMAIREMERIAEHASQKWPTLRVVLIHRLGDVPVGEASVLVGVATSHRAPAFEACRFLIDELKKTVPVWKREVYADGSEEWVGGTWDEDPAGT